MTRAVILVLDSFGIGATADAEKFGDVGANTLGHIAERRARAGRPLALPNLARLGLLHAARDSCGQFPEGCATDVDIEGAYGYAAELSTGKDTPSGHWEMAGVPVLYEWGYFRDPDHAFPEPLLAKLIERGRLPGVLGNCHASGTEIIERLGEEHVRTGKPIVYTSADSVFQIAAHEEAFGLERLLDLCLIARELVDEYRIGRVIARPFRRDARANDFVRTGNRRDYAVPPPAPTVLDKLVAAGGEVIGIGKIPDIFAHQGISREIKATGNAALFDATLAAMQAAPDRSIVFSELRRFRHALRPSTRRRGLRRGARVFRHAHARAARASRSGRRRDSERRPRMRPDLAGQRSHSRARAGAGRRPGRHARPAWPAREHGGHRTESRPAPRLVADGSRHRFSALITARSSDLRRSKARAHRRRWAKSERSPRPNARCGH